MCNSITIICIKNKVVSICITYFSCYFLKSETSLNVSYFDQHNFIKIQTFDCYDVIMTLHQINWLINNSPLPYQISFQYNE